MSKVWIALVAACVACLLCSTVYGQANRFTVDGAFDYETSQAAVSWWPDPNGGIGLLAMSDSAISEDTERNYALGACVTFAMNEAYAAVLKTILPAIEIPQGVPVKTYGRLGATWDINDDGDVQFIAASGAMFLPKVRIQPTIWAEYIVPEHSADEQQEIRALFGVTIWLGK